jgi:hypothetical protein
MDNAELERIKDALRGVKPSEIVEDAEVDLNTIDLSKLTTSELSGFSWPNNVTITANTGSYGSFTIPTLTSTVFNGGNIINTNNTNPIWTTTSMPFSNGSGNTGIGKLELDGDDADILIKGRSLKEFMEKMEERLAILVPDPAKLEHFEALKRAYDHYKTLEALCELPKPEDDK